MQRFKLSYLLMSIRAGWLLAFCLLAFAGYGQSVPAAQGFVNDYSGILSANQRQQLESYLTHFAESTSNEVAILIDALPSGESVEPYTLAVAESWGVGGQQNDNGILIAVYPNVRKMRIEVGYGLEGAVPDIVAYNIIEQYMKPAFRVNDYFTGLSNAVQIITGAVKGEYDTAPLREYYNRRPNRYGDQSEGGELIVLILIIVLFVFLSRGGGRGKGGKGGGGGWIFFPWFGGGSWGGNSGGGWGGGGFGGGGFGGFGGGGFGGGGASGSW